MTVAAEEHALARLGPRSRQRSVHPSVRKVETLCAGVEMMKLENLLAAVIATNQAFAPRLFH
jgi:hypothetical protein